MPSGRKSPKAPAAKELTAAQAAELREFETNWEAALEALCRIGDRRQKGGMIPFRMRKEQRKLFDTIQLQRSFNIYKSFKRLYPEDWERVLKQLLKLNDVSSAWDTCHAMLEARPEWLLKQLHALEYSQVTDSPVLIIVGKARRIGVSTLSELLLFLLGFFNPLAEILVLSVDDKSAQSVLNMTGKLIEHWPADKEHFKPEFLGNARDRLKLHNGAKYESRTIGGGTIRGFHHAGFHLTEFAHYPDQEAISDALIAKEDHSWVIIESTAKGKSGDFYNRYQRAVTIEELLRKYDAKVAMPDMVYVKWFSSWLDDPEYVAFVEDWERPALEASLDDYEKSLFKRFPNTMSLERVKWRREKMEAEGQSKKNLTKEQFFMQEYPADEEEMFQQGSKNVFDHNAIARQKLRAKERLVHAHLLLDPKQPPQLVSFDYQANCTVWEMPKKDHLYIIGSDIGGGLLQDYTVHAVYDRLDGSRERMVAVFWTNRYNEIDTAHIAVMMARMYNDAFLIPEANNYGHSFMNTVWQTLRYRNMYTRESTDSKQALSQQDRWGYDTRKGTKQELIAQLQEALKDDLIEIFDLETLVELELYELTDPTKSLTKMGAPVGEHDDRVIATALARFGARPLHGAPSMSRHLARLAKLAVPGGPPAPSDSPTLAAPSQDRVGLSKQDAYFIEEVYKAEQAWDLAMKKKRTVDKRNPFAGYN